jgi:WD40 repeat protein
VAWQPHQRWWLTGQADHQQQQQQQQPASQLFLTASNNGNIKVWDVHDVLQACQERLVSRHAITSTLWLGPPHVWLTASADGSIRTFWVDAGVQATGMPSLVADGETDRRSR